MREGAYLRWPCMQPLRSVGRETGRQRQAYRRPTAYLQWAQREGGRDRSAPMRRAQGWDGTAAPTTQTLWSWWKLPG